MNALPRKYWPWFYTYTYTHAHVERRLESWQTFWPLVTTAYTNVVITVAKCSAVINDVNGTHKGQLEQVQVSSTIHFDVVFFFRFSVLFLLNRWVPVHWWISTGIYNCMRQNVFVVFCTMDVTQATTRHCWIQKNFVHLSFYVISDWDAVSNHV